MILPFLFSVFGQDVTSCLPSFQEATDPLEKAVLDGRQLALKVL